jgi:D-tyrosyl-tRNA(Tyr) deacylase
MIAVSLEYEPVNGREYALKAVIQRVMDAGVTVSGIVKSHLQFGLLVYLGVERGDTESDADWIAAKTAYLRVFEDADGKMNLSLKDITEASASGEHAGVLAVSQFTLLGDARKGRRPSWDRAAPPESARRLYDYFISAVRRRGITCESGEFQAHMKVTYTNDGPVTILLDTRNK